MKKKVLIMGIAGLMGAALGFHSCVQNEDLARFGETTSNQTVLRAQTFFETGAGAISLPDIYHEANGGESGTRSADIRAMLSGTIEPDWSDARVFKSGEFIITEVPAELSRPVMYSVTIKERGKGASKHKQVPHTRIRVVERLDIDSMFCFVVTMLPDKSYKDDPWQLAADPEGSKFTGITLYSLPDGTPAWGWHYKKGEVTHTLHFDATAQEPDPDITFSMGIEPGTGASTRSGDRYGGTIEEVECTGTRGNQMGAIPPIPFETVIADDRGYDWVNDGGGGGDASAVAPLASKLFRGGLSESDWKKLEKVIKEIMANCMGGSLYNELDKLLGSGTLAIQIVNNPLIGGNFDVYTGTITIADLDSGSVFHEMLHAYQAYQESVISFNASSANREIEAYLAELRLSGKIERSDYRGNIMLLSDQYISPNGVQIVPSDEYAFPFNDVYRSAVDLITVQYAQYRRNLNFDKSRSFNQNFKNLRYLSNNC